MDIIEVSDRSKARSGNTKDTFVEISGARYLKSRTYDSSDFPTYLVSKGCWYEKRKEKEHLQQLEKAGFVPHKHCTHLFAYLRGRGVNRQIEIELHRTDISSVKVPGRQYLEVPVKPVEHKGQKRKLVLPIDGTVHKVKRS